MSCLTSPPELQIEGGILRDHPNDGSQRDRSNHGSKHKF